MINIKFFFLVLPCILNDTVRSQKEDKWYPENPVGRGALRCWVRSKPCRDFGLGVLCKPRILLMTVTVWHYILVYRVYYILQWHQGSYCQISPGKSSMLEQFYREGTRALTNLLFQWKRVKSLLGAAFWEIKKKKILHKPASTWSYSFVVSTNSDHFLVQWNTIFSVFLLLKRWGLSSEQGRRPETSFEKLLIQYLSPWNLRESREVCRRKFLILSNLTIW